MFTRSESECLDKFRWLLYEDKVYSTWLEKAIRTFAPSYRRTGQYSIGSALISPVTTGSGADRYKAMRDVKPGDLILHFINNESIAAVSFVAEPFRTIRIDGNDMYAVPLRGFVELSPPLRREALFTPPFSERLVALLGAGLRNTFYTRKLQLAQGAYLTPVPRELLEVIDEAYREIAATTLTELVESVRPKSFSK